MSDKTTIEWTDTTWNPIRGCSKVSPGCEHCYAMHMAARFSGVGEPYEGLAKRNPTNWTGQIRLIEAKLGQPLKWKHPRRVFVNSMSDVFHEDVPDEFIDRVFAVMAMCPQHTFQVLTKRAERMAQYTDESRRGYRTTLIGNAMCRMTKADHDLRRWPLPNVWLGISCEDQQRADERIPWLLETPAAVRFVSAEPLLGPIDLKKVRHKLGVESFEVLDALHKTDTLNKGRCLQGLDWVIVGGESGRGARACNVAWIRSIVQQCQTSGVACFVKQLGGHPIFGGDCQQKTGPMEGLPITDSKGGDPAEWPEDLRVRQFPT